MQKKIILYTTHCPKCEILKSKLQTKQIVFEESSDINFLIEKGFLEAPILEIDGEFFNFGAAVKLVNQWGQE